MVSIQQTIWGIGPKWLMVLLFLVFLLFLGGKPVAASINYNFREEAKEDAGGDFIQKNWHRFTLSTMQELTDKLKANESVNSSSEWAEGGGRVETVSPSFTMTLSNDLFSLDFVGSSVQTTSDQINKKSSDSDRVGMSWRSEWDESIKKPSLSASFSSQNSGPIESNVYTSTVRWDVVFAKMFVNLHRNESLNHNNGNEEDAEGLQAQMGGSLPFMDNRLNISYGYQFTDNRSRHTVTSVGGTALISLAIPELRTGVDSPLDLLELPAANANPQMLDGDLLTTAYSIPQNTTDHTFLMVTNSQQVDVLYLYVIDNWGGGVPPWWWPTSELTNWRLYSTDFLGSPWTVEAINPASVTYEAVNQRLVIRVPAVQRNYLKLVVDRNPSAFLPIVIAEAELFTSFTAPSGTAVVAENNGKKNMTSLGFSYQLAPNSLLGYNLSLNSDDSEANKDESVAQNVTWSFESDDRTFHSDLQFSDSRNKNTLTNNESQNTTYSLDFAKRLLSTLNVSLGASQRDTSIDGVLLSRWDEYSFYCDAELYPDLHAKLTGVYNKNNIFTTGTSNDSISANFQLSSRLRPSVDAFLGTNYTEHRSPGTTPGKGFTTTINWNWAVSGSLSLRLAWQNSNSNTEEGSDSVSFSLVTKLNKNMSLDIAYSATIAARLVQSGSARWNWYIVRNLYLNLNGRYSKVEGGQGGDLNLDGVLSYSFRLPL